MRIGRSSRQPVPLIGWPVLRRMRLPGETRVSHVASCNPAGIAVRFRLDIGRFVSVNVIGQARAFFARHRRYQCGKIYPCADASTSCWRCCWRWGSPSISAARSRKQVPACRPRTRA
ncbi:protein of unknown function [Bradyrhizobium vignae]|uniref:Uncharacterized protein n=1 Tax=Bradyrhizobium vignae TaxID=1549949 RepID=A0A2U3PY39_9BRAD|nr:protein of unknown function [Bradyrhizobium vignae]